MNFKKLNNFLKIVYADNENETDTEIDELLPKLTEFDELVPTKILIDPKLPKPAKLPKRIELLEMLRDDDTFEGDLIELANKTNTLITLANQLSDEYLVKLAVDLIEEPVSHEHFLNNRDYHNQRIGNLEGRVEGLERQLGTARTEIAKTQIQKQIEDLSRQLEEAKKAAEENNKAHQTFQSQQIPDTDDEHLLISEFQKEYDNLFNIDKTKPVSKLISEFNEKIKEIEEKYKGKITGLDDSTFKTFENDALERFNKILTDINYQQRPVEPENKPEPKPEIEPKTEPVNQEPTSSIGTEVPENENKVFESSKESKQFNKDLNDVIRRTTAGSGSKSLDQQISDFSEKLENFRKKYFDPSGEPNDNAKAIGVDKSFDEFERSLRNKFGERILNDFIQEQIRNKKIKTPEQLREAINEFKNNIFEMDGGSTRLSDALGINSIEEFDSRYETDTASGVNERIRSIAKNSSSASARASEKARIARLQTAGKPLTYFFNYKTWTVIVGCAIPILYWIGSSAVKPIQAKTSIPQEAQNALDNFNNNVVNSASFNGIDITCDAIDASIISLESMKDSLPEDHKQHTDDLIQSLTQTKNFFIEKKSIIYNPIDKASNETTIKAINDMKTVCSRWINVLPNLVKAIRDDLKHPEVAETLQELQTTLENGLKAMEKE
jgi:hypothetical protein